MSIESMTWVLKYSPTTGSDKVVLLGIANHDGDGGAWPKIETLAKYANMSERGVQKVINRLVEAGHLTVLVNQGGNEQTRPDHRPNRYVINGVNAGTPRDVNGVNAGTSRGEPQGAHGVNPSSPEPSYEPSNNHPTPNTSPSTGASAVEKSAIDTDPTGVTHDTSDLPTGVTHDTSTGVTDDTHQETTLTRRETSPPPDGEGAVDLVLVGEVQPPTPTAADLVKSWIDGHGSAPSNTALNRVRANAKRYGKECSTLDEWRSCWALFRAAGAAGVMDVPTYETSHGRPPVRQRQDPLAGASLADIRAAARSEHPKEITTR